MASDIIKIKRGNKINIPILAEGEPAFVKDEAELYIGTSTGNIKLTNKKDIGDTTTLTTSNKTNLVSAVNEVNTQLGKNIYDLTQICINILNYKMKDEIDYKQAFMRATDYLKIIGGGTLLFPYKTEKYVIGTSISVENLNNVTFLGQNSTLEFLNYNNTFLNCSNLTFENLEIQGGLRYSPILKNVIAGTNKIVVKENVFVVGDTTYNSGLMGFDDGNQMPIIQSITPIVNGFELTLNKNWINNFTYKGLDDCYISNSTTFTRNLKIENCNNIIFNNVRFRKNRGYALQFINTNTIKLDNVTVIENGLDQIAFLNKSENIKILNSNFYKNIDWAKQGLYFGSINHLTSSERINNRVKNIIIQNCNFKEIRDSAIWLACAENVIIDNCNFEKSRSADINADYVINLNIKDTIFNGKHTESLLNEYKESGDYSVILAQEYMEESFKPYSCVNGVKFINCKFTDYNKDLVIVPQVTKANGYYNRVLEFTGCEFNITPNSTQQCIAIQQLEIRETTNVSIVNCVFSKLYTNVFDLATTSIKTINCNKVVIANNKIFGINQGSIDSACIYIYSSNCLIHDNYIESNFGRAVTDGTVGTKPLDVGNRNNFVYNNIEICPEPDFFIGVNNNYSGGEYAGWGGTAQGMKGNNVILYMSNSPASGNFKQGDIIFNTNPVVGSFEKWICITSGNPGVWKGIGQI